MERMNTSRWEVGQGRELEVTAPIVPCIPPGGSTCTPPDSNSLTASAGGAEDGFSRPWSRQPWPLHYLSGGDLQSVPTFLALMPPQLRVGVLMRVLIKHLHTRKTSHPSKNILAVVFYLFVCGRVSKRITHEWQLCPFIQRTNTLLI